MKKNFILTFTIILILSNCIQIYAEPHSDCYFEKVKHLFVIENAEEDATYKFKENKLKFLAVGNGYSPTWVGFEKKEELNCIFKNYGFKILRVGFDVAGRCEDRINTENHALLYARPFNSKMKKLLINSGKYECNESTSH